MLPQLNRTIKANVRPNAMSLDSLVQGLGCAYRGTKVGFTGAREQFWLDALASATNDSGYQQQLNWALNH